MYNKGFIQRVCTLTCTEKDVIRNISNERFDTDNPFEKYYDFKIIKGAIEKFISNKWDDRMLAHWACAYCWVLSGGSDYCKIVENLNSFESFFRDVINWALDGLSFFDAEYRENGMYETIQLFENYDHIWQTRDEWNAVYAMVGPYDEHNGEQWVALINDLKKEYILMNTDHLKNGYEDEYFKFVTAGDFIEFIERLKNSGYNILSCDEESYYEEINDL